MDGLMDGLVLTYYELIAEWLECGTLEDHCESRGPSTVNNMGSNVASGETLCGKKVNSA